MVKLFYIMIEERCDLWIFNENGCGEVSKDLNQKNAHCFVFNRIQ